MASVLKQVLTRFEDSTQTASLSQIAHEFDLDMTTLQGMVDYWVRKGKLREVVQCDAKVPSCNCGGGPTACPFIMTMPRSYEPVPVIAPDDVR